MSQSIITSRDLAAYLLCGVAVAGVALASYQVLGPHHPLLSASDQVPAAPSVARLGASGPDATAATVTLPSFDVVRVEPNGDAVIAGRAAPGAVITVLRNGTPYAESKADSSGAFALVLPQLPVGASEMLLSSDGEAGASVRSGKAVTAVIAQDRMTKPMVAITSANEQTIVISAGEEPGAALQQGDKKTTSASTAVRIASVDVQAGGGMFVSGQVTPDAKVRLSFNGRSVAEGQASHDGRVTFDVRKGAQPGDYLVRLDELSGGLGSTKSHAEAHFTLPTVVADSSANQVDQTGAVVIPQIRTSVVSQGDNLWTISRRAYGRGPSYTLIFGANRQAIRDPNKIYPKQVFVIPASQDPVGPGSAK